MVVPQSRASRDSLEIAIRAEPALGELIADHHRSPALFDNSRTPLALFTIDGTCVAANEAANDLLGGGEDLTGVRLRDLLDDGQRERAVHYVERAVRGESFAVRASHRSEDGRLTPVEVEFVPAIFEDRAVGAYVSWRAVGDDRTRQEVSRRLQEMSSLFEHSLDTMLAIDLTGRVTAANPAAAEMLGFRRDELLGVPFRSFVDPAWLGHAETLFVRAVSGQAFADTLVARRKDSRAIDVEGTASPILVDGSIVGLYVVGRDITARRRLESDVHEQTERIHELYLVAASAGKSDDDQIGAALELGMRRLDCDGAYLAHVKNGEVTYRYAVGRSVSALNSARPLAHSIDGTILADGASLAIDDVAAEPWAVEGAYRAVGERGAFIGAPVMLDGVPYGTVGFVHHGLRTGRFGESDRDFVRLIGALAASAIERGEQRRRLDTLAFFDALTGLPNRTLLNERIEETIDVARRRGRSFAIHFLDLDGFKYVNDSYGHPHGDQVLRALAQRLSRAVRKSDIVARLGGDEFVILQPEINRAGEALEVAGRLRELISEPVIVGTSEHRLGCSIGIAIYPNDGPDGPTLLARADNALYRVKDNGRNGVAFATPPPAP